MNKWTEIRLKQKELHVVTTTQSHAMDIGDLFSQIGGFFGLLMGASLMTILEVLQFLIQSFLQFLKLKWQCKSSPVQISVS